MKALVELCRQRSREGRTPRMKGWWTHEANALERDPSREELVRRFLVWDPRLKMIDSLPPPSSIPVPEREG